MTHRKMTSRMRPYASLDPNAVVVGSDPSPEICEMDPSELQLVPYRYHPHMHHVPMPGQQAHQQQPQAGTRVSSQTAYSHPPHQSAAVQQQQQQSFALQQQQQVGQGYVHMQQVQQYPPQVSQLGSMGIAGYVQQQQQSTMPSQQQSMMYPPSGSASAMYAAPQQAEMSVPWHQPSQQQQQPFASPRTAWQVLNGNSSPDSFMQGSKRTRMMPMDASGFASVMSAQTDQGMMGMPVMGTFPLQQQYSQRLQSSPPTQIASMMNSNGMLASSSPWPSSSSSSYQPTMMPSSVPSYGTTTSFGIYQGDANPSFSSIAAMQQSAAANMFTSHRQQIPIHHQQQYMEHSQQQSPGLQSGHSNMGTQHFHSLTSYANTLGQQINSDSSALLNQSGMNVPPQTLTANVRPQAVKLSTTSTVGEGRAYGADQKQTSSSARVNQMNIPSRWAQHRTPGSSVESATAKIAAGAVPSPSKEDGPNPPQACPADTPFQASSASTTPKTASRLVKRHSSADEGKSDAACSDAAGGLGGEHRLTIHFDRFGTKGTHPQTFGKNGYCIPDGLRGTHRMYSQEWTFEIVHSLVKDEAYDSANGGMCCVLTWSITNVLSNSTVSMMETPQQAFLRQTKGNTICNLVLRSALENRIAELSEELSQGSRTSLQRANLQSLIKELCPKKCAQGLLFFGLRHECVQRAISRAQSSSSLSSSLPSQVGSTTPAPFTES